MLLVDLDHLKPINDQYGHAAGDATLISFVQGSQKMLRSIDYLARVGGDEFAVLLPETDLPGAMTAAQRLKCQVGLPGHSDASGRGIMVSVGVAVLRANDTLNSLLQRADTALYEAKAKGRNQIVSESSGYSTP